MKIWPDEKTEKEIRGYARLILAKTKDGDVERKIIMPVLMLFDRVRELEKQRNLYRMACEAFVRYDTARDTDAVEDMLDYAEARSLIHKALAEDK
jgi:hypothetical protein